MLAEDLDLLCSWVRQESPTSSPDSVNAMASLVQQAAPSKYFAAERITGRSGFGDMLLLRGGPQNGKPPALLIGHSDTVHPLGVVQDRFPVRVEDDRLYGPGVYDMKAGLLIGLKAAQQVLADGSLNRPLIFILSPDEEVGSPTSRAVIENLAREAAYALVLEPAREDGSCVTCRKGVGRFEISVEGVASHAGVRHSAGRNAIAEAAHQILKIEALTDYERGVTTNVGLIAGGTTVNTVPQECRFSVDFRAPTLESCNATERAIKMLEPVIPGTKLIKHGGINRPPYERTDGNIRLFQKAQGLAAHLGLSLQEAPQTGGGSDGNFTAALGVPTLDGLGADGAGAHTLHEYATLSTLDQRTQLIAELLRSM
jgi:glutamate carboxypeptidase